MRISTASFYNSSLPGIQSQQSEIARLNQQIASNKNYLAPKDNPVATSQILALTDSITLRDQYLNNIQKADLTLQQESTTLQGLYDALNNVKSVLQQSESTQDQSLRDQTAVQLANYYLHIKDLANSQDSTGNYIFAGSQTDTLPFEHTASYPSTADSPDTIYAGDTSTRSIAINQEHHVQVSDTLTDVFQIGSTTDLLEAIDQAAVDLADGGVSQPTLDTMLESYLGVIDTALDELNVILNSVTGRMTVLNDTKETLQSLQLADQNALSDFQGLDQTAAILELQQRETTLEASMQAFSTISDLSLFKYL